MKVSRCLTPIQVHEYFLSESFTVPLQLQQKCNRTPKLLVVEDEGLVALSIEKSLQVLGYSVCGFAATGEEALSLAREHRPDLALVDIKIRGHKDGIETAQLLRQEYGVPAIFLTAHSDSSTVERAKLSEPFGYIIKPYSLKELRSAIEIGLHKNAIEQNLRKSKAELTSILGSLGDAVISCCTSGTIRFANRAAAILLQSREDLLIGENLNAVCSLHHLVTGHPIVLFASSSFKESFLHRLPNHSLKLECALIRDGESRTVELSTALLGGEVDRESGILLVIRDLTEQRQIAEQQKALESQLYRAQKMQAIGQLAGGIAHDFNNLLTAIMGNLALLRAQLDHADICERLSATEQACVRAADLVGKLLAFSRKAPEQFTNVCMADLVKEVMVIVEKSFPPEVTLSFNTRSPLPEIFADPNQIHQVLMNLILNSRDAITAKEECEERTLDTSNSVAITLYSTEASRFSRYHSPRPHTSEYFLVLSVEDSGIGMSSAVMHQVFEPFFTTKEVGRGTGLGMSVVYGIVNRLNGWIDICSSPARGTSIKVYFPVAGALADAESASFVELAPGKEQKPVLILSRDQLLQDLLASRVRGIQGDPLLSNSVSQALRYVNGQSETLRLVIVDSSLLENNLEVLLNRLSTQAPHAKVLILQDANQNLSSKICFASLQLDCVLLPKPPHPDAASGIQRHLSALSG